MTIKFIYLFSGLGWGMLIMSAIVTIYYNAILTWVLFYLGSSFTSDLPWATCNNKWNTLQCVKRGSLNSTQYHYNITSSLSSTSTLFHDNITNSLTTGSYVNYSTNSTSSTVFKVRTPAEEFWQ